MVGKAMWPTPRVGGEEGYETVKERKGTNAPEGLTRKDGKTDPGNQDVPRTMKGGNNRVARLKAIGNGQVPAVVQLAWRTLAHNYP